MNVILGIKLIPLYFDIVRITWYVLEYVLLEYVLLEWIKE